MTQKSDNKPTHGIYHITDQTGWWTQIGCGWTNKDLSISMVINYTPKVPGNIVLRKLKEKTAEETKQAKKKAD